MKIYINQININIYEENQNFKNNRIFPLFTFESDDNAEIIGITPLSTMYMENLQHIDNKDLFESEIYIYIRSFKA